MPDPLQSITPLDGRYWEKLKEASNYFSEYALMRARLSVEARYLIEFTEFAEPELASSLPANWKGKVEEIVKRFTLNEAREVKDMEKRVGHDVKALVDYMRGRLEGIGLGALSRFVHFGLTSEDVNNLAYSILLRGFLRDVYLPELLRLVEVLAGVGRRYAGAVMLARTHGQPAAPTTFGRFISNYAYRVAGFAERLEGFRFQGKLGGAVGDHAALKTLYPELDWVGFSRRFVEGFGLEFQPASTQILPHDRLSELLSTASNLNAVLANLCRDLWLMGALDLLSFARRPGEAHSSTMPHKSNPLHIENAEGALDLSAALLSYMARRLLSSRLHRDLSDSIIKRFYGAGFALSLLGVRGLLEGLGRMRVLVDRMRREVEERVEVLGEAAQLELRRMGVEEGYEVVQRALSGGWSEVLKELEGLRLPERVRERLGELSPVDYVGVAEEAAELLSRKALEVVERVRGALRRGF